LSAAGLRPPSDDEQLYLRLLELGECLFALLEKRYAPTRSMKVKPDLPCHLVVKIVHVYAFYHIILALHLLCIPIAYYVYVHAYRIARGSHSSRIRG
jgi:hypothetical protein